MKRTFALMVAVILTLLSFASVAEYEYPEKVEGIDLGGKTIYILDSWSSEEPAPRSEEPTEEEALKYAWQDWIMETYNCKVVQIKGGSSSGLVSSMKEYVASPDKSEYRIYYVGNSKVMGLVRGGYARGWDESVIDINASHWNKAAYDFMYMDGVHYTLIGPSRPNNLVVFNKRLLSEAGIDPESLYDMQAEGTWTWEAFEEMLKVLTKDTDNDGVIDTYGWCGDFRDLCQVAPYLNGAKYFDFDENGNMVCYADSEEMLEALNWCQNMMDNYMYKLPEGAKWKDFVAHFKAGKSAFMLYVSENVIGATSEVKDMEDEFGILSYPLPNGGTDYKTIYLDKYTLLPACYDDEEAKQITFIWNLWNTTAPGVDPETAWIGDFYSYTDERGIDETYAMLRQSEHGVIEKAILMSGRDEMIDDYISYTLLEQSATPAQAIETAMQAWNAECADYNASHAK